LIAAGVVLTAGAAARAEIQGDGSADAQGLRDLSIEELAQVEITSVSKRPEPVSDAAAAIFVITAEDIRRSGATRLAEALRLAPNLEVAELNSYSYTITARGFNSPESANKLLVLVDGRSVYSPLASTVFWDALNPPLDNIERIEVISGPGGTLWGANAVNGVINIITRDSRDTTGAMAHATAGGRELDLNLRYGASIGETGAFRITASAFDRDPSFAVSPANAVSDRFKGGQVGIRLDNQLGRDLWTVQGSAFDAYAPQGSNRVSGGDVLGRWTRDLGDGSGLEVQAYYDTTRRSQRAAGLLVLGEELHTWDLQAQHNIQLGGRNQLVVGGELRAWRETLTSGNDFHFAEPARTLYLGNVFVQDELKLRDNLKLTLGLKAEDNSYSGLDWLPNVRLAYKPAQNHLLWGAVSRAVRTPSRIDRELEAQPFLAPSPDFAAETLTAYELGYRTQLTDNASLSVSAFYNVYDGLRSDELTAGGLPIVLGNGIRGDTYGFEAWGDYKPLAWWRLSAGFSNLHRRFGVKPGHVDIAAFQSVGQDPSYQAFLRSRMDVTSRLEVDAGLRAIGAVKALTGGPTVPAYAEADARLGWRVSDGLELALEGMNLLHDQHLEANDFPAQPLREIGRSVYVSLSWGF
jgi:iron complex outermembrane receptor protein